MGRQLHRSRCCSNLFSQLLISSACDTVSRYHFHIGGWSCWGFRLRLLANSLRTRDSYYHVSWRFLCGAEPGSRHQFFNAVVQLFAQEVLTFAHPTHSGTLTAVQILIPGNIRVQVRDQYCSRFFYLFIWFFFPPLVYFSAPVHVRPAVVSALIRWR